MSYLQEFKTQINNRDLNKILQLWEEYCASDQVEVDEFAQILDLIKTSEYAKSFGKLVETILPLWETITDPHDSYRILTLIVDIQTTNSPSLAELALRAIETKYPNDPKANERLRLVGLRTKEKFQGALSYYDLLAHIAVGKFVYHAGGWGVGEIIEVSQLREQLSVEFENVAGKKHFTFSNAFNTLLPLADEHFLARRFGNPDRLEREAKEDPVKVIKLLLQDLGPKTAAEIKDELSELVIPEADWTKWWQNARAKVKKDPLVETPVNLKDSFKLRAKELTHEEKLQKTVQDNLSTDAFILSAYNFIRDLPNLKKNFEVKESLKAKLLDLLKTSLNPFQEIQVILILENLFDHSLKDQSARAIIEQSNDLESMIQHVPILALKKRILNLIRNHRQDWEALFLSLLLSIPQAPLKDYILSELNEGTARSKLVKRIEDLIHYPMQNPEALVWYFQKIVSDDDTRLPFGDKEGQGQVFEAFLILFSQVDAKPEYKDLLKKMYNLISGKRFAVVRKVIEGTSLEFIKEFLLLVSKCQALSDHDVKILRSLAEVVHPSLAQQKTTKKTASTDQIIWTSEEGYLRVQDKIRHIGTIEIVENAREIEAARALGDLRENSEYKFALEKRSRLQGELKTLSEQMNRARIITPDDINVDQVSVGCVVDLLDSKGNTIQYTILGPWDANPDEYILSFQSKFAQAMVGCEVNDRFSFRDEEFTIQSIQSFFAKRS